MRCFARLPDGAPQSSPPLEEAGTLHTVPAVFTSVHCPRQRARGGRERAENEKEGLDKFGDWNGIELSRSQLNLQEAMEFLAMQFLFFQIAEAKPAKEKERPKVEEDTVSTGCEPPSDPPGCAYPRLRIVTTRRAHGTPARRADGKW